MKLVLNKDLTSNMLIKYDLFIFCCSFESRSLALMKKLSVNKTKTISFYNKESIELFEENLKYVQSLGKNVEMQEISIDKPLYTADNMIKIFNSINTNNNIKYVLLDITSFTHEALLIVLKAIHICFPIVEIDCAYVNATEYSEGDSTETKWLSKGIGDIRSILGYPGNINPSKKTHLIIIVGYEIERAYGIINEIEPNSISIGYGKSEDATTEKDKSANEHYSNLLFGMSALYYNISKFEIKCNDPLQTARIIEEQIKLNSDKNIIIVPLNNKISTIAVAKVCEKNENIQVCYAKALEYNYKNYSREGECIYIFKYCALEK